MAASATEARTLLSRPRSPPEEQRRVATLLRKLVD